MQVPGTIVETKVYGHRMSSAKFMSPGRCHHRNPTCQKLLPLEGTPAFYRSRFDNDWNF